MKPMDQAGPIVPHLPKLETNQPKQKQPFVEPKLTWVEPKLISQGTLTATAQTGGFFGSFSP